MAVWYFGKPRIPLSALVLSFGALRIEERAFQRYRRWSCLARLTAAAVVENFGFRQWNACIRARACGRCAVGCGPVVNVVVNSIVGALQVDGIFHVVPCQVQVGDLRLRPRPVGPGSDGVDK